MDILKRKKAPFSDEIWSVLESEARAVFARHLTGRKVVDYVGEQGIEFAGINTGKVVASKEKLGSVGVGVRESLPVLELKVPFVIKEKELDLIIRGASQFDNSEIVKAAKALCEAENTIVFDGLKKEGIDGVVSLLELPAIKMKGDDLLPGVAEAVKTLKNSQVEGPYALLIQPQYYSKLFSLAGNDGYPVTKKLNELLKGGEVLPAPAIKNGALVMSLRGGDFEMIGGVDISMGFEKEVNGGYELFLFETLTFRVNTPEAAIALNW